MIPNTSNDLYVQAGSHRYPVRAFSDEGVPLISTHDRIAEPAFDNWSLIDEGIVPAYKEYNAGHVDLLRRTERLEQTFGTGDDLIGLRNEIISGDDDDALELVEALEHQDREIVVNHHTKWPGLS